MQQEHQIPSGGDEQKWWQAVLTRNPQWDGKIFYAVTTTGVFCRPSCPSRRPKRENIVFFSLPQEAEIAGFRACLRCRPLDPLSDTKAAMVAEVCRYIEEKLDESLTLAVLSQHVSISPFHLQRTFKAIMGITPHQYVHDCRLRSLKAGLRSGQAVTQALYEAGYGSSSRLYERSTARLGMTPATYGRNGRGTSIGYTVVDSLLGPTLVAATEKGLCSLQFGDSEDELVQALRQEYAEAIIERDDAGMQSWLNTLTDPLLGEQISLTSPLDIRCTAFQRSVWEYLQTIPPGTTMSYSQVAAALGQPRATRAVARACASNPVAQIIPCHRVVHENGQLGGYRWGIERKRKLLEREQNFLNPPDELNTQNNFPPLFDLGVISYSKICLTWFIFTLFKSVLKPIP